MEKKRIIDYDPDKKISDFLSQNPSMVEDLRICAKALYKTKKANLALSLFKYSDILALYSPYDYPIEMGFNNPFEKQKYRLRKSTDMTQLQQIRQEIERQKVKLAKKIEESKFNSTKLFYYRGKLSSIYDASAFIMALSTEQQEKDVDLEKEIEEYTLSCSGALEGQQGQSWEFDWEDITMVIDEAARHFYELGKNAK